ncbi:MAG TPA: hypothetical protein VK203_19295 [Nostocaceae cyanobacterium]|nr:hypothetical protein [Nostocaceae cyanobacterium]
MNTNLFYGLWENEIINAIDGRDFTFTRHTTLDAQSNFHSRRKNTLKQNTPIWMRLRHKI